MGATFGDVQVGLSLPGIALGLRPLAGRGRMALDEANDRFADHLQGEQIRSLRLVIEPEVTFPAAFDAGQDATPTLAETDGQIGAGMAGAISAGAQFGGPAAHVQHAGGPDVLPHHVHLPMDLADDAFVRVNVDGEMIDQKGVVAPPALARGCVAVHLGRHLIQLGEGADINPAGMIAEWHLGSAQAPLAAERQLAAVLRQLSDARRLDKPGRGLHHHSAGNDLADDGVV